MSERFFIEPIVGLRAVLSGSEVHHLASVMRAKVGDEITLFDGSGDEFVGRIELLKKDRCDLVIVSRRTVSREAGIAVIAGVALPKGDRQKSLVEKLTELGVTTLVPLLTARGVVQPGDQAVSRLQRTVIEASKQCGRNRLMEISQPIEAGEWFRAVSVEEVRLLADPAGEPLQAILQKHSNRGPIHFAVGPEGGFTPAEIESAVGAGWRPAALGKSILRIETAAIAVAACCIGLACEKTPSVE